MPMYKSKFFMGELNLTCDKWQKQIRHVRKKINKTNKHTNKKLTRQANIQKRN